MRRFFAAIGAVSVAIALSGVAASANSGNDGGYNPPPQVQGVCDAGHGAFGAFSHYFQGGTSFEGSTIPVDAVADGGMGAETGPANSGVGQACIGQNP